MGAGRRMLQGRNGRNQFGITNDDISSLGASLAGAENSAGKKRYKTPSFQKTYDAMPAAANNPASELYFHGKPHRGAAHRVAFWDGFAGVKRSANVVPGTLSSVCYAAGMPFAKTKPGISVADAVWTHGVTRQGEPTN